MKLDFTAAKTRIKALDARRLTRALEDSSEAFRHVLTQLSLLFQINHPLLPGYVDGAPFGIADFHLSDDQKQFLCNEYPADVDGLKSAVNFSGISPPILGLYVMGSFGSISQTSQSDLDVWICHEVNLSAQAHRSLQQKAEKITDWANQFHVEIHFYFIDQQHFRNGRYTDPLTDENSGSAQYMLLLDEFYRSAVRLAGKPLLWLHLWVEQEKDYETEVAKLIEAGKLNPNEWIDFGGLGQFSANEYFGASLWQLYKGIDSPYKSALKILLLEAYSKEYPHTRLIARQFKNELFEAENPSHHFDPYIAILDKVSQYLTALGEFKRLNFVRRCFYVKVTEDLALHGNTSWRTDYIQMLAREWGWSKEFIAELNRRPFWKIKRVKRSHETLMTFMMQSYRNLVHFARAKKVDARVIPRDIDILTRKLYTAFEPLPGKVDLINRQISYHLDESNLTFVEVKNNPHFKDGWYLINQAPNHLMFSRDRLIEYGETLNKLVAWAYFNHLLTAETELHLISRSVELATLRNFVADLRLSFPRTVEKVSDDDFLAQCKICTLIIAVNLTNDPTKELMAQREPLLPSDLFSFGPFEQSLVGSIDFTYRNVWNEIRTLHFEGPNAILLALKVLSNKIYHRIAKPRSIQVFCYSRQYRRILKNLVNALINRCVSIRVGEVEATTHRLRVAGKNWQFFFEEQGISLQEIISDNQSAVGFDDVLTMRSIDAHEQFNDSVKKYPREIDLFASEGFLQFFFEDNADGTFNVYILDEGNHLEVYRHCDGQKADKVREINQIYQSSGLEGKENPYKIVQRDFNYPQFYLLQKKNAAIQIVPFQRKVAV